MTERIKLYSVCPEIRWDGNTYHRKYTSGIADSVEAHIQMFVLKKHLRAYFIGTTLDKNKARALNCEITERLSAHTIVTVE